MRPQYLHQRRLRQFAQNGVNVAGTSAASDWDDLRTASKSSSKKGIKEEECVPQSEGGRVVGGRILDQLRRNRGFSASELKQLPLSQVSSLGIPPAPMAASCTVADPCVASADHGADP